MWSSFIKMTTISLSFMKKILFILSVFILLIACKRDEVDLPVSIDNPEVPLNLPIGFPKVNSAVLDNRPTKYGVQLGEKLFNEKRLSGNNTISCASCHNQSNAFADNNPKAIGIYNRVGLRNTPPIQNLAFMEFYNWDGNILELENQPLVPIITHEEMNSSILEVIGKLKVDKDYADLFFKAFGDSEVTAERIYKSIAQYAYMLVSANSKYDRVKRKQGEKFTDSEARGYAVFQLKCANCHSGELFTDQSFRNIGFPLNPSSEEAGRARVTGKLEDYMAFRVPSLRNAEFTAPYGSFGQFPTLKAVLDYLDAGVENASNLDPVLKNKGNRIEMTESEKLDIISFINTLSDKDFVGK
jgi:cytochrome c peroxidase